REINEYLFEDREEKSLLRIMQDADADIMCFGHTHKPYHRVLTLREGETARYRHAINIGSVGKPKDGNPQGGYVLLSFNPNASTLHKESLTVEFVRFDYDIEKAAKAVEDSPLPDAYASSLRNGI
ncbi:MAG: YfcE family phosphodiesterase, partial [Chitinophagaceae bacterium]